MCFHLHADFISTLSSNANKELAIEQALESLKERWREQKIEMAEYKSVYFKVRSTEDLFTALEDDQVAISTIKASPFFMAFEEDILCWEKILAHISEVIELVLAVQRCWMYLESIFMTSEDIRKQLPTESMLFDEVNKSFKSITSSMANDSNAKRATHQDGMLELLNGMDSKLDRIQKSLDQYLETKRMYFPRFYFLSNDDLLEILGHQKDPDQVQKHIKKCYEGIQNLTLIPAGARGNPTIEAIGMNSPDGEQVPFPSFVVVDGPVEGWLKLIEAKMVYCLQKIFPNCLAGSFRFVSFRF